jgi:2-oxoglutarate ferredoxin oxidoreductase subunit alpha
LGSYRKTWRKDHIIITSLELDSLKQEQVNIRIQKKYKECEANEVRYEALYCDDAEYLIVAYGSSARISQKAIELARAKGIKVGLLRPITLWPFPSKIIHEIGLKTKGILSVEMNAGQMIEDVKLAVECKVPVEHFGRFGGIIPSPSEVLNAIETKLIK